MDSDPVRALLADRGVVCVTGAGGKKTTLYALARRLGRERGRRTVVTATVRIPIFDAAVDRVVVTATPRTAVEARWGNPGEAEGDAAGAVGPTAPGRTLGLVPGREGDDRYRGYEPGTIDGLAASDAVDAILVKADGARTREVKAPADHEPRIPGSADVVLPVASVAAVGQPLDDRVVHRPDRFAAIAGRTVGEPIRATDVATVLADDRGGLKGIPPGVTVVAVLNKVDDRQRRSVGETIARDAIDRSDRIDRVVLTRMVDPDPVVAVIEGT